MSLRVGEDTNLQKRYPDLCVNNNQFGLLLIYQNRYYYSNTDICKSTVLMAHKTKTTEEALKLWRAEEEKFEEGREIRGKIYLY